MDEDVIKRNIKTIKEIVIDEQRPVTYISLSKELCMHVNDTKILLTRLVEDLKRNYPKVNLTVNYVISGLLKNNSARTIVCSEGDVENRKLELKSVLYQHIYSVGQGLPSQDTAILVAVNSFDDLRLCTGLIKSDLCSKHTSEEIDILKSKVSSNQVSVKEVNNLVKKEIKHKTTDAVKKSEVEEIKNISENCINKSEPIIKSEKVSPKKEEQSVPKIVNKKNAIKPSKNITGFFTKTNGTKNNFHETKTLVDKVCDAKTDKKDEKMDLDDDVPTRNEVKNNSKLETKKTSLNTIKRNAKVDNKRKRVLHVSDSESDNEKEKDDPFADELAQVEHESEDEIPPTPHVNTVKITSGIVNPKKRRKIVDKTYTDEEGYILTKKEEVYESCSDEDISLKENIRLVKDIVSNNHKSDNEVSPKEKKSKIKKKVSPPQKGKQATLMNFFKKVPNKA